MTVDLCTGISEEAASLFTVIPNPTNGQITLQNTGSLNGLVQISITDVTGRLVVDQRQVELSNLQLPINLSHLESGQYFLNVVKDGNRILTKRISKN